MVIFFLLPILAFSSVIRDDVSTTDKARFSYRTVCTRMVAHESPLIDVISGTELDCMGKKIEVGSFCEQILAQDPYYIRAYVDRSSKEVVCHSGKKVLLKYQCTKLTDAQYCQQSANIGCQRLKDKLAKRLDTVHTSFTKTEKGIKELNCYFESLPVGKLL